MTTSTRSRFRRTAALIATGAVALIASSSADAAVNGAISFERFGDIYVARADGKNATNLTASPKTYESQATYSPDGTKLAFVRDSRDSSLSDEDVWVMNADGTGGVQVAAAGDRVEGLSWSGDGTKLLFWTDKDANEIIAELYSVNPDGSGETMLTADGPPIDEGGTQLAVGGNKVAWVDESTYGNREIVMSRVDVAGVTRVTNDPGVDLSPALSADGSRIAWSSDRDHSGDNGNEVYVANADGTGATRVTNSTPRYGNYPAAFSPDGTKIAYNHGGIVNVINADGTSPVVLTPGKAYDFALRFSPDGTRVLYQHTRPIRGEDPYFTLDTVRLDGSGHRIVADKYLNPDDGDWQALDAPQPAPDPLALDLDARPAQRSKGLRTAFTCSNECAVTFRSKGRTGGEPFKSKVTAHGYGDERGQTQLLTPKARSHTTERPGRVTIVAVARDQFGNRARDTAKVKLNR